VHKKMWRVRSPLAPSILEELTENVSVNVTEALSLLHKSVAGFALLMLTRRPWQFCVWRQSANRQRYSREGPPHFPKT